MSDINISGRLSAIPKPEREDGGRKSNITKSAAPRSRSQNRNKHDDDLPEDGVKSQRISNNGESPEPQKVFA